MRIHRPKLAVDARCILGEGPVWWNDVLWFVDIEGRALHRYTPADNSHDQYPVPGRIGFALPRSDGSWLIAQDAGVARFEPDSGTLEPLNQVEPKHLGTRMNDAKSDPTGRVYAGTMSLDVQPEAGALYRLDTQASKAQRIVDGVTISNGLAWDASLGLMYYIDTATSRIDAFDWCEETGEIQNRRSVATLKNGAPDGMCIDNEGALWVALWGGSRVARVDPITGEEIEHISLPCENPTSCCFGGPDFDQLWITSARVGLDDAALQDQPHAGGVFVADVGVKGPPTVPAA